MTTKIVILNSPPRSGKDTTADGLVLNNLWYIAYFKKHLIHLALTVSGVSVEDWDERYQEQKDLPWHLLGGLSQRQFLIKISEDWVKPTFGAEYFGNFLVADINKGSQLNDNVFIIPDGGFEEEVIPLIRFFGEENILILQWGRGGRTFKNDSRDWIRGFPSITQPLPKNNGYIQDHINRVEGCILNWLDK